MRHLPYIIAILLIIIICNTTHMTNSILDIFISLWKWRFSFIRLRSVCSHQSIIIYFFNFLKSKIIINLFYHLSSIIKILTKFMSNHLKDLFITFFISFYNIFIHLSLIIELNLYILNILKLSNYINPKSINY